MGIRRRRLEAESDGLGRGDDVLSYSLRVLIKGIGAGITLAGPTGAVWSVKAEGCGAAMP